MNLLKLTFGLCLSVILTTSCSKDNMCTTAQGAKTEQLRNTPSFDEINLRIPGDVVLSYGKDIEVTVNAASNLQSIIETNVSGYKHSSYGSFSFLFWLGVREAKLGPTHICQAYKAQL